MAAGVRHGPEPFLQYSPPFFGMAFAAALPKARQLVRANLRRVMGRRPPLEEMVNVAAVFSNYASCLTEAMLLGSGRGAELVPRSQGIERYHACAAEGRGVIIATAHTGGWEIAGPVLSGVHPAEVIIVMRRERDERARAIQDEARSRAGVKVVHIGDSPFDALPLLRHLRGGAVVAMQIDRAYPGMRSREVKFVGAPWQAPEGPLTLSALSGAPILPIFMRRVGFMEYEAVVEPPIRLPRRPTEAEMDGAAQEMTGAMERFVRAYPTQWFHFGGE
jgi:lauroyl/myristoyl acyltransferase